MKKKYYVVDEDEIKIKRALLDLESNEYYYQKFESEDGIQYKDPIACSKCKLIKYYNELTNDERIRTGKSYKQQNIFNNEQDAQVRIKEVIREKANKIQHEINKLTKKRENLIDLLFQI